MKAIKRKIQPPRKSSLLRVGQAVRITKVLDQMLIDSGVEVGQKGIIVDIPDEGVIEVFVLEIHQGWFFTEDALAPWKEYTQNANI